jgi:hypothetical protein
MFCWHNWLVEERERKDSMAIVYYLPKFTKVAVLNGLLCFLLYYLGAKLGVDGLKAISFPFALFSGATILAFIMSAFTDSWPGFPVYENKICTKCHEARFELLQMQKVAEKIKLSERESEKKARIAFGHKKGIIIKMMELP